MNHVYKGIKLLKRLLRKVYQTIIAYIGAVMPDDGLTAHTVVMRTLQTIFLFCAFSLLWRYVTSNPPANTPSENSIVSVSGPDTILTNNRTVSSNIAVSSDNATPKVRRVAKTVSSPYVYPYDIGLTTRENMMIAAMSLVGDVRYVWGGGHSGASYIKGINPVWKPFRNLYPDDPTEEGFGTCIKPSGSWCPIHGNIHTSFHGETIYSIDQYIDLRSGLFDEIDLTDEKYRDMLSTVDYSNGVNAHVLDGLDCSGYVSWIYNQIQNDYKVNTAARYFTRQSCFTPLSMGARLLPGDIFAWKTHIVMIVGHVIEGSKAYVTLEETPNVLRFGVAYYSGAAKSDIEYGKQIASEANALIGGLDPTKERPHVYCINTVGTSASAVTGITSPLLTRYEKTKPDENTITEHVYEEIPSDTFTNDLIYRKGMKIDSILASEAEEFNEINEIYESNEIDEIEEIKSRAYSSSYDTVVDGVPYKVIRVFMPRGYPGSAQDIGAPAEGTYDYKTIDEQEEGFYGTYYIKIDIDDSSEEIQDSPGDTGSTNDPESGSTANTGATKKRSVHSSDEKVDGFIVRHIFMPYDFEGTLEDLGVPDDSIVDHKEVTETKDGFYGTYYIKLENWPYGWDDEDIKESEDSESYERSEDNVLRLARYAHAFEDEDVVLDDTGVSIEDMDAVAIIQHTINKLPLSMIDGYETYDGELFSLE